jgi:hypothetical protein
MSNGLYLDFVSAPLNACGEKSWFKCGFKCIFVVLKVVICWSLQFSSFFRFSGSLFGHEPEKDRERKPRNRVAVRVAAGSGLGGSERGAASFYL